MIRTIKPLKSLLIATVCVSLSALLLPTGAGATSTTWRCGSDFWNNTTCWSAGQPTAGDDAYLTQSDATDRTVTYRTSFPSDVLSSVQINATGTGTMTLWMAAPHNHQLRADYEYIGITGTGTLHQELGQNYVTNDLILGWQRTGDGTYELSGSGLLIVSNHEYVGYGGTGNFIQSGGGNSVADTLYLGHQSGDGTYDLSGGSLSTYREIIGNFGTGDFIQSGGTNTINFSGPIPESGKLIVGNESGYNGTYNLGGTGSLSASYEIIGEYGTGIFNQTGGTNTATSYLSLGRQSTGDGTYVLSGGDLSAPYEYIGEKNTGAFTHSNGTNTVTSNIIVGLGSGTNGTYDLSNLGNLSANTETIGYLGTGIFTQDGGTNTLANNLILGYQTDGDGTYTLNSGSLSAVEEEIGSWGTGVFTQTGGANTVADTLTLATNTGSSGSYDLQGGVLTVGTVQLNPGGTFTQSGGTLDATTFNQSGGTVNGTLQNQGTYNYNSGPFTGRLLNQGVFNYSVDFTFPDGMENQSTFDIPAGRTVTLNGSGLDNNGGTINLSGVMGGSGPMTNSGLIHGAGGTIAGTGGFTNYGTLTLNPGDLVISNTGANTNSGNIDMAAGYQLRLDGAGVALTNAGSLALNDGFVTGTGSLANSFGGTISGRGTIAADFANSGGVLLVEDGTTTVVGPFANSGLIQLSSYTANLAGGAVDNTGSIEGHGHVGNDVANTGVIEPLGSTLTLSGELLNYPGGLLTASAGNKLLVTGGLATNAGVISLAGGTFDNNNQPMANTGQVSGYGTLRTGGLTNQATVSLTGGTTTVNGDVTNSPSGSIQVAHDPAIFTGDVTNQGTVKVTNTTVTFAGTYTEAGTYVSDPADNYFADLVVEPSGHLVGGVGDNWFVSGDFINQSAQNTLWDTVEAYLGFTTGTDGLHDLYIPGLDEGQALGGYTDNFSWGTLELASGNSLSLFDGNATSGAALYVGEVLGLLPSGAFITNITGSSGLNIYYNETLTGNSYLGGYAYNLSGGGKLIPLYGSSEPIPEPATLLLLGTGLVGLGLARGRWLKAV